MSRRKGPRTRRDCTHPKANHQHGTPLAYRYDHCRCEECTDAASAASLRLARQKAYGRHTPVEWVDATPARDRVVQLMADGFALHTIATAAGLDITKVSRLIYGLPSAGVGPTERMRAEDVRALGMVAPSWRDMPDSTLVPAVGSVRRVQALACIGWPAIMIAERIGTTQSTLSGIAHRQCITAGKARAIADVYEQLSMTPAPDGRYTRRLRSHAQNRRWAPPLAWDDETIDDPAAKANLGEKTPRMVAVVEEVEYLLAQGVDPWRLHEQTGHVDHGSLRDMLRRVDRHDLADRITSNPWGYQDYLDRRSAA